MATENQKKVFNAVIKKVRNGEKISISKAMREAGMSKHTSRQPDKITKSKGWKELMDEHFDDEKLAITEAAQLNASHINDYVFDDTLSNEEIRNIFKSIPNCTVIKIIRRLGSKKAYFSTTDNVAVAKSLDRIYKLKKKYPKEELEVTHKNYEDLINPGGEGGESEAGSSEDSEDV